MWNALQARMPERCAARKKQFRQEDVRRAAPGNLRRLVDLQRACKAQKEYIMPERASDVIKRVLTSQLHCDSSKRRRVTFKV